MKQLLFLILLLVYPNVIFAIEDKCKTDVYFANGILTEDSDAKDNAYLLEEEIKQNFGLTYFKDNIGKVDYAYNSTEGPVGDLLESLAQKLEGSIQVIVIRILMCCHKKFYRKM